MRPRGRSAVRALQGLKEDNCVPRSATSGPEADPAAVRDAAAGRGWRRPRPPARVRPRLRDRRGVRMALTAVVVHPGADYRPGRHPAHPQPANLLPDQVQSPDRFYAISSRDFTAVFAR
jgi:hypothetical protein